VLRTETSGSGVFYDLAVVVRQVGQPVNLATALLGDWVQIEQIVIDSDLVRLTMLQAGPMDPLCCHSQRVTNMYAIDLTQSGSQAGTMNPLAGMTWSWQETLLNDGTQVTPRDGGMYTVAFGADGLVQITADCNLSSGSCTVAGDQLAIALGPTTLAFCPPPSLSDVFLNSLAVASAFQRTDDALLINLTMDGGTMRFTRSAAIGSE
jgi:heat shock protein HslJ